jgi:glycerophosphoryl diester phosphodiesterase
VVAHRGDPSEAAPENTLAAFGSALDAGADAVEFDVRLTADGVPVVIHDAAVDRTTEGTGIVRSMTVAEVKRLRIAGGHEIPTL